MLKKTLLSLAITASTAGLTACNISSISDNNEVENTPVASGQQGPNLSVTQPVFSVANSKLPLQIDLLFAAASATDGTASVTDNSPVTNAINDIAGFSATSAIDIPFNAALSEATDEDGNENVKAGHSVWLVEFKSKEDNSLIDSLDLASITSAEANPFALGLTLNPAQDADQLIPGRDYVAEYVEMDGGATPTIRIQPLKPLDPKTKYMVVVTDKLKDEDGNSVAPSDEYNYLLGNENLISDALIPVRKAVKGWNGLAQAFLSQASPDTGVVLSYTFTTEANDDVLLAMAAPETYISNLLKDTKTLEGLLGEDTVDLLVAGTAQALNAGNAENPGSVTLDPNTAAGKLATRNTPQYKALVTTKVAQSIIGSGAAKGLVTEGEATVSSVITSWNDTAGNEGKQIPANPADWTSVHYDYIARALGKYDDSTDVDTYIALASNGAGALLKNAAHRPASRDFVAIAGPGIVEIPNTLLKLPEATKSMQGMLTLPQFMKAKSLTDADSFKDFWKGSTDVGAVIDGAFGNDSGTTPPSDIDKDSLGFSEKSKNVTYRFPFAQHVEDVKVPVLVTYPTDEDCTKPPQGWKTIIFQHGITTDRTASLGFANSMASPAAGCFATVAMDLPTHGVDAYTTERNHTDENPLPKRYAPFNGFNVAGYVDSTDPTSTPFAATLAGLAKANDDTYAGLQERHGNLALDAQQKPKPMVFTAGSESGNSGDFFINLTNFQQTRDHLRQAVMDILNLNASIGDMDIDGGGAGDLDVNNLHFAGHSLGAIAGLTAVAVNNAIAKNPAIVAKELNVFKTAVLANPGGQLPKLLENSPSFSKRILPGLAEAAGLTQGSADLEKFFSIFQAPLDSVDPINFTDLLKSTDTPVLMFEMVGGGAVSASDQNTVSNAGPVTGLPATLITAGEYPADTVVPNNANPALDDVETGKSYLTGTDPLVEQLELMTVASSRPDNDVNLMLVSKFKEGTHGTISSADAITVFSEMIGQTASFFTTDGQGLVVGDADQLEVPAVP